MTEQEPRDVRLKRLRMRAWHRGTKEMDLVLGTYADRVMPGLDDAALDRLEALMDLPDQELFSWISGAATPPDEHAELIASLRATISDASAAG